MILVVSWPYFCKTIPCADFSVHLFSLLSIFFLIKVLSHKLCFESPIRVRARVRVGEGEGEGEGQHTRLDLGCCTRSDVCGGPCTMQLGFGLGLL